jgi:hypothetical protein
VKRVDIPVPLLGNLLPRLLQCFRHNEGDCFRLVAVI